MSYYTKQIPLTLLPTIMLGVSWEMLSTPTSCLKLQGLIFSETSINTSRLVPWDNFQTTCLSLTFC